MNKLVVLALTVVLAMMLAAPAFATGADGAGLAFGQHHAAMAQDMGGFTGSDNPGVNHRGFSGWMGM